MSDRERLVEVRSECHPLCGSTDRHPEDFCHRCGGPNISWYTPGGVWDPVMRPVPGAPWKWHEIICPICFVELAGSGTWALIPRKGDEEPWTSADERAAISAEARAGALREAADVLARKGHRSAVTRLRALAADEATGDEQVATCDHPGVKHGPFSYTWPCPRCGVCKFIGHGPLCGDCYATSVTPPESSVAEPDAGERDA